jgi:hypothetical protein
MWCAAMFEEKNALPCSQLHFFSCDWHGLAGACQDHANVGWHVVAAFGVMREVIGTFRHQTVKKLLQIVSRAWVGIFHNDDAATGVLNKNRDCAVSHPSVVDLGLHVSGNFIKSLATGAHFELVVVNAHCERSLCVPTMRAKRLSHEATAGTLALETECCSAEETARP